MLDRPDMIMRSFVLLWLYVLFLVSWVAVEVMSFFLWRRRAAMDSSVVLILLHIFVQTFLRGKVYRSSRWYKCLCRDTAATLPLRWGCLHCHVFCNVFCFVLWYGEVGCLYYIDTDYLFHFLALDVPSHEPRPLRVWQP